MIKQLKLATEILMDSAEDLSSSVLILSVSESRYQPERLNYIWFVCEGVKSWMVVHVYAEKAALINEAKEAIKSTIEEAETLCKQTS